MIIPALVALNAFVLSFFMPAWVATLIAFVLLILVAAVVLFA